MPKTKTELFVLNKNCNDHCDAIERAYKLIGDNFDIFESWFDTMGKPGKSFTRHFNGGTRIRYNCSKLNMWARAIPPGMELAKKYLENLRDAREGATTDECVCLDIDLSAVMIHEAIHLCGHFGEHTAWSFEAWWRSKITERLGLSGTRYCTHKVENFPADGKWDELKLADVKALVGSAVGYK